MSSALEFPCVTPYTIISPVFALLPKLTKHDDMESFSWIKMSIGTDENKQTNKHKKHTLTFNVICRCISPWAVCGTARGTCPTQAFKYLKCYQHWIIQVNFRLPLPNAEAHSVPRNMLRFGRSLSVWILIDCVKLAIQVAKQHITTTSN